MSKFIVNKFILNVALICLPLTFGVAHADDATAPTAVPPITPTAAPVLPSTDEQSPLQHMRDEANPPPNYIPEDPNVDVNGNYPPPPPPPSSNVEIINPSSTPSVEVQTPDVEVDSDYYGGYGYDGYGYDRNRGDRLERHNDNYNSERREQYNEQQMRQQEHHEQQHHQEEHHSSGGHMGGGHGGGGRR